MSKNFNNKKKVEKDIENYIESLFTKEVNSKKPSIVQQSVPSGNQNSAYISHKSMR